MPSLFSGRRLPPTVRRAAPRELVCPDCGDPITLQAGFLVCAGHAFRSLADLEPGDRYRPDCHLTVLSCRNRRTRECVRWEIETGRRMVGKGRAS